MYTDEKTGMFKGQALVTYFKPESVDLAIRLLDESVLRVAEGKREPIMRVQKAEFGVKVEGKEVDMSKAEKKVENGNAQQPPRPKTEAEKRKAQKRFAKMNK
jgi:HIV Tat-specific factor 1